MMQLGCRREVSVSVLLVALPRYSNLFRTTVHTALSHRSRTPAHLQRNMSVIHHESIPKLALLDGKQIPHLAWGNGTGGEHN